MNTLQILLNKYSSILLCGMLLFFSCSKDVASPDPVLRQLVLTLSSAEIDIGEEVAFAVHAEGEAVDADIYIDNQKITGNTHTFTTSGDYKAIAKKSGYTDSEIAPIEVYSLDIYVSGVQNMTVQAASSTNGMVWKNGALLYELANEGLHVAATSMAIHNNDVYVTGTSNGSAGNTIVKYWKNNQPKSLTDGTNRAKAQDIAFDGNDMYIIGTADNPHNPVFWKNDALYRLSLQNVNRYVRAITTYNGDVYIVGNKAPGAALADIAVLWLNGREIDITGGHTPAIAIDVAVDKGDVYILGREKDRPLYSQGRDIIQYWKNGAAVPLEEDATATIGPAGIAAKDGDVYVCGWLGDGSSIHGKAVVWKNGKRLHELTDGTFPGSAYDIAISGNDVYVVGDEMNSRSRTVVKVWKNGQVLYELSDGIRSARGLDIAIVRKK